MTPLATSARCPPLPHRKGAILVLGQVEDDRSITVNENALSTNRQLIERALGDHPDGTIYFKQHPDCIGDGGRPGWVDIAEFPRVQEIAASMELAAALSAVDIVYTISSLGGFEALLRGRTALTFGSPFYAGWGLTSDHVSFPRRKRRLNILELFYISYLVYPTYFDPKTGRRLTFEDVVQIFAKELGRHAER